MDLQRYKKVKTIFVLLLISLLLHLLLSFLFLEFGFKKRFKSFIYALSSSKTNLSPEEKREFEQRLKHKREALQKILQSACKNKKTVEFTKHKFDRKPKSEYDMPAKLVAPKSNFGWVIFDDNYKKPEKLEIPTTKDGDLIKTEQTNAAEVKSGKENINLAKSLNSKVVPEAKHEAKLEKNISVNLKDSPVKKKTMPVLASDPAKQEKLAQVEQVTKPKNSKSSANFQDYAVEKSFQTEPTCVKTDSQDSVSDRIKKIQQMQQTVAQYQERQKDKDQERKDLLAAVLKKDTACSSKFSEASKFVWGASELNSGKSKNLIVLTKGYIEKTSGENGTDLIDRDGDPNKKPNFEELKYLSYEAKLNWCCQATWKQNSSFYNLPVTSRDYQAVIEFSIDEKGNLVSADVLESSGSKEVDLALVKNLKNTAPFPPLPKHFARSIYTTGRVVTVSISRMGF